MAGAPKGNRNAFKHGLYSKHYTPETLPELKRMPSDNVLMELAALRLTASRALDLFEQATDFEQRNKAINTAIRALEACTGCVIRAQFLEGDSPVLEDLWEAIRISNEEDGINDAYSN
jgi:hypothetical protein